MAVLYITDVTNSFRTGRISAALSPGTIAKLTGIYEFKGKQALFEAQAPDVLAALQRNAVIESTDHSNRIEGVEASPSRVREIVGVGSAPTNRDEAEIAGYRDVLSTIHASFPYIPVTPGHVLHQLHRDLFKYAGGLPAGVWKSTDNKIEATLPDGTKEVIFIPVSAFATPIAMEKLCADFQDAWAKPPVDPLLLTGAFVLDFLCVHPLL